MKKVFSLLLLIILLTLTGCNEETKKVSNKEEIMGDVLAVELCNEEYSDSKEWDINGEKVTIGVQKV